MNAIFLDRDGVVIQKAPEGEYISDCSQLKFLAGALQAIADLCRAGYKVIVVTNQRGVATGKIAPSKLTEIHSMMRNAIISHGGVLSAIYCCTHEIAEGCACRKPKPGMLLQAAAEHDLDLTHCWMVGDSTTDIGAGKSARCKTALITESEQHNDCAQRPDIVAGSLAEAAKAILALAIRRVPTAQDR